MSEDKLDKLLAGQSRMEEKIDNLKEKTKDQESRIRSLEKKFWTSLSVFFLGIGTFIEGLFMNR
jgi:hypothetical protein